MSMKLLYEGKTKNVYDLENGNYLLKFKDDVTGTDGVFDPGANTVGLSIEGIGKVGLRLTEYFYKLIGEADFPTHFVSADIEKAEMTVLPASVFGKGLEVVCRYRATGSFVRRYGLYATEGQTLNALVEITLKDDAHDDPLITADSLDELGVLTIAEYDTLRGLTKDITGIIKNKLAEKGLELYDIKLEFGRNRDGKIILIDEISGGCMRVYKDGKIVDPLDLVDLILA